MKLRKMTKQEIKISLETNSDFISCLDNIDSKENLCNLYNIIKCGLDKAGVKYMNLTIDSEKKSFSEI